jgi:stage V sporulation protein K
MEPEKKQTKLESLDDLISMTDNYIIGRKRKRPPERLPFNLDLENISYCVESLCKLNGLIGMKDIKKIIIDQILFYAQGLNTNEMMHTCLSGPPGTGKTTLAKILAEVYCSLGFLKTNKIRIVGRSDLIAGYLGQTALKTMKVLNEAKGGVLFIDEAYSLGVGEDEKGGSFGKECIDTINKFLSENTEDFIMIIAGYKDDLDRYFFGINKGLRRRFPWNYEISEYSNDDLRQIFIHQVETNGWGFEKSITLNNHSLLNEVFEKYSDIFVNNGGDTLILFDKAKICHSRRVFGLKKSIKKYLNLTDIKLAAELMKSNIKQEKDTVPYGMYV